MNYQSVLKELKPAHDFFIGIDSDGCVFDSMEVKQKEFFIPNALKYFNLYPIAGILKETWEFVNLCSIHRGGNRFISLIKVFELLGERKELTGSGLELPDLSSLKEWVRTETKLGNDNLRKYYDLNYDPELEKVVKWTEAVNMDITERLGKIPPFPHARSAIELISAYADLVIVSQTPLEALAREWKENDLSGYVMAIAGQEHGTKAEHISLAATGKYSKNKMLMIGDARGDLDAARKNRILFFPVIPGEEDKSWNRFIDEGFDKFTRGTFAGPYEDSLLREFSNSLPLSPPWK